MTHRRLKGAKMTFATMVPVTVLAFYLGSTIIKTNSSAYWSDYVALIMCTGGVFAYNYFDERP